MIALLIFLYIVYGVIGIYIYKYIYKRAGLIHPFIFIYIDGFLNYFYRSYYIISTGHTSIPNLGVDYFDIFVALTFVTIIFIERALIYKKNIPDKEIISEIHEIGRSHLRLYYILYIIILCTCIYNISTGNLYTIGDDFMKEQKGFSSQILGEISLFKTFIFFLGIYIYKNNRIKKILYMNIVLFCIFIFMNIVSTSKGQILSLIIIALFSCQLLSIKINYKIAAPLIIAFMLLFSQYSYYVRFYGATSGVFNVSDLVENYSKFSSNTSDRKDNAELLARYYYLDPIIYLEHNDITNKGIYEYGSIRDVQGIIPGTLYPNKPKDLDYGLFTGKVIFGNGWSEEPIGRLGELFSLFGFLSIFIYPIFILLGRYFYTRFIINGDILEKCMYFNMFFVYFNSDSGWIFYGYRLFVESLIFLFILRIIVRGNIKKSS